MEGNPLNHNAAWNASRDPEYIAQDLAKRAGILLPNLTELDESAPTLDVIIVGARNILIGNETLELADDVEVLACNALFQNAQRAGATLTMSTIVDFWSDLPQRSQTYHTTRAENFFSKFNQVANAKIEPVRQEGDTSNPAFTTRYNLRPVASEEVAATLQAVRPLKREILVTDQIPVAPAPPKVETGPALLPSAEETRQQAEAQIAQARNMGLFQGLIVPPLVLLKNQEADDKIILGVRHSLARMEQKVDNDPDESIFRETVADILGERFASSIRLFRVESLSAPAKEVKYQKDSPFSQYFDEADDYADLGSSELSELLAKVHRPYKIIQQKIDTTDYTLPEAITGLEQDPYSRKLLLDSAVSYENIKISKRRLVTSVLEWLPVSVATTFYKACDAALGKSIRQFDPKKQASFDTFALWNIKAVINRSRAQPLKNSPETGYQGPNALEEAGNLVRWHNGVFATAFDKTTKPEHAQVLKLSCFGMSKQEIADRLGRSHSFVDYNLTTGKSELGLSNKTSGIIRQLFERGILKVVQPCTTDSPAVLTKRQWEALDLFSRGKTLPEVQEALHCSEDTIKNYWKRYNTIFKTTGMRSAIMAAFGMKILEPDLQ